MPASEILIAFFLSAAVFAYVPGPAVLYATAQTISGGKRAGFAAAFGLHIGGYLHVFAAAFGLAVIFQIVPSLFVALKLIGAAYLIWLGYRMLKSGMTDLKASSFEQTPPSRKSFWQSATVEMLNPKTALFYLAFLPQFTDPTASFPIWLQLLILGTIVNVMFSSADFVCVILADRLSRLARQSSKLARAMNAIGGGLLIFLGLRLAMERS
ncbi:MAG: LysE family translocator [Pseudomonadota bacterium]